MKNNNQTIQKKVALYDPFFDVLGGGERHILSILQVLEYLGYEINIFWDEDLTSQIEKNLKLSFTKLHFHKNIFRSKNSISRLKELGKFDILFYVTDGSYFVSSAKKTFIFCMVPNKKLYNMNFFNKIKLINASFIANSDFTKKWLSKWGIDSKTILPYISDDFLKIDTNFTKKNQILSVGRFFPHLHSKRQDVAIDSFIKLQKLNPAFANYTLHLAGSVTKEDEGYLEALKKQANNNPAIIFHPNIEFSNLIKLYQTSAYYWHFAGFDVDENEQPEKTEHLGITPLEAMAAGCITMAYNAGGPKEIIEDGANGFLFNSEQELFEKMDSLIKSTDKISKIKLTARKFIEDNFSYSVFTNRVKQVLLQS